MHDPKNRDSLELLYEVSREFAAALDLRTVLHRVLFLSMRSVGGVSGSIIVLDSEGQPVDTAFLIVGQTHDRTMLQLRTTYEQGMAGWVAKNRQAVLIPDTSQDERWLHRPDDAHERTGPKSAVSAPILARDDLVGVITLVHPQPQFFTQDHLELVKAIADQAGIAILNARLYAESQHQAQVMTAVAKSAAVITASLDLRDVLQRILNQIPRALGAQAARLALVDAEKNELEYRAFTLKGQQRAIGLRVPFGRGIAGWVAMQGQGIIVPDVANDPRFAPDVDKLTSFESRAILCVPIQSEGQVIGVLEAINPETGSFDEQDLLILNGISSMAGTAIRHAQLFASLEAAHSRYRDLFEDSIDPILITDLDGYILEANHQAEAMIGLEKSQLRALSIEMLHDIDWEKVGEKFENLVLGHTVSYEAVLRAEQKRRIPIQVFVRSLQNDGVNNLQWILRDISEGKKLDQLREDLTAMIYHDLRSPLANVVASLGVLASMPAAPQQDESVASLINIALRSTQRIQRLTDSLLDINRLEAGQAIGNRKGMAPAELIADAVEAVLPASQSRKIQLIKHVESSLPQVFVDADMIRRVLINLLENALKFTPAQGKIQVGAKRDDDAVLMWVKDSGPGISKTDQERIFEKFTRLSAEGPRGLGLGLSYCRLAIVGHGGKIWVESETNDGSSFMFTLPLMGKALQDPTQDQAKV
ncbi:MAG: GAF domain-containing protein [Chloroflexota bacterium]